MPTATCPGALPLAGPPVSGPSVICGPLANDQDADPVSQQGGSVWSVFTSLNDPGTFHGYCCGRYTACSIWRAEKERIWAAQRRFVGEDRGATSLDGIEGL